MTSRPWDEEPVDVIGDADPYRDEDEQRPDGEPGPRAWPRPGKHARRWVAVATVAFAAACAARVGVGLWRAWQVERIGALGVDHAWQVKMILAGINATGVQMLTVVTVVSALATVALTWFDGHTDPGEDRSRHADWRPAVAAAGCAAMGAGVVLMFYLLALGSELALIRSGGSTVIELGGGSIPATKAAQAALIAAGATTAGVALARYALSQHRDATMPSSTPQ